MGVETKGLNEIALGDIQSMKRGPGETGRRKREDADDVAQGMSTFKEQAGKEQHTKETNVRESEDKPGKSLEWLGK